MPIRGFILLLAGPMVLALLSPPIAAGAQQSGAADILGAVRDGDVRLTAIGYRLATANAALCDRLEPGTGLQLHSIEQYDAGMRGDARHFFGFDTPVAIEGIIAGSPAARAGLRVNQAIVAIGPVAVDRAEPTAGSSTQRIVQLHAALAALPPSAPLLVRYVAGEASIQPVPACRTRFELKLDNSFEAQADGVMVQIGSRFLDDYDADQVAALVAHELAHNILHHRERLEAKGVSFGMLAGFGRNVKYFRQTETEADLLSVYLLANAGYDPQVAVRFWERFGKASDMGFLADRTHPGWKDRLATVRQEAEAIARNPERPLIPPILAARDKPLDGNWQGLLVRHR